MYSFTLIKIVKNECFEKMIPRYTAKLVTWAFQKSPGVSLATFHIKLHFKQWLSLQATFCILSDLSLDLTTFWIFSEVSPKVSQGYTNISELFGRFSKSVQKYPQLSAQLRRRHYNRQNLQIDTIIFTTYTNWI